ncbi:DUF72 domain-containing protein [Pseudomonas sp. KNUC1026]|uniref:DUF72 domain-containing protein n=1 Tax=Pseudomonas sp. KNUC1026 TaxID=2893890 RepID=UPI003FA7D6DC
MKALPYHLGCPSWSEAAWREDFYPSNARPPEFLAHYAQLFNAVEGNTTFYARPAPSTVERWAEAMPEDFRFTAKFPRDISHEGDLRDRLEAAHEFIRLLAPLGPRVSPFWLQLPASFGAPRLAELITFLEQMPVPVAVEVRNGAFFARGQEERLLNRMLLEEGEAHLPGPACVVQLHVAGAGGAACSGQKAEGAGAPCSVHAEPRRCASSATRSLRRMSPSCCLG